MSQVHSCHILHDAPASITIAVSMEDASLSVTLSPVAVKLQKM